MADSEQYVSPGMYMEGSEAIAEGAETAIEGAEAVVEMLEGSIEDGMKHGLQAGFQPGSYVLEGFYTDHDVDQRKHKYYRRASSGAAFGQVASVAVIGAFPLLGVAVALVDIPYSIMKASETYEK